MTKDLAALESALDAAEAENKRLTAEVERLNGQCEFLRSDMALESEIDGLQSEVSDRERRILDLTAQLAAAERLAEVVNNVALNAYSYSEKRETKLREALAAYNAARGGK